MLVRDKRFGAKGGVSLLAVSMVMMSLALLSLAMFNMVNSGSRAQKGGREEVNARYVSEAGLSLAVMDYSGGAAIADITRGNMDNPVNFGSGSYWVEAVDLGNSLVELTATGVENNVGSQLKLVLRETTDNMFVWAAFGDEGMTMDSNAQVDSYNSSLGTYGSQDVNGNGANSYALTNGNVGSNQNVSADSNVKVHGDLTPGPTGTASVMGNAAVSGATAPATHLVDMPAVQLPTAVSMGDLDIDGSSSGPFTSYFPSGTHQFDAVTISGGNIEVVGPATLIFDSFEMDSNAELLADTTNGPVEIYVVNDFIMDSNTLMAPIDLDPAGLTISLLSDNILDPQLNVDLDEVDFNSNAKLYGTVYAPSALVEVNSNFELFGSLIAREVHLDSNARVHFDENLLAVQNNADRAFETIAWRHTPFKP